MRFPSSFTLALALATAPLPAQEAVAPDAAVDERIEVARSAQSWYLGDDARVEVDLTVGVLSIEGTDERDLSAELRLSCSPKRLERCRARAEKVHFSPRSSRGVFEVRLENTPGGRLEGIHAELTLRIPRHLPLEIDIRGGDVTVEGMTADLEIDGAGGQVKIGAEQSRIRRVTTKVGFGSADLWVEGAHVRGAGFPRSIDWTGSGAATIEVDLGGGDVVVTLR